MLYSVIYLYIYLFIFGLPAFRLSYFHTFVLLDYHKPNYAHLNIYPWEFFRVNLIIPVDINLDFAMETVESERNMAEFPLNFPCISYISADSDTRIHAKIIGFSRDNPFFSFARNDEESHIPLYHIHCGLC